MLYLVSIVPPQTAIAYQPYVSVSLFLSRALQCVVFVSLFQPSTPPGTRPSYVPCFRYTFCNRKRKRGG